MQHPPLRFQNQQFAASCEMGEAVFYVEPASPDKGILHAIVCVENVVLRSGRTLWADELSDRQLQDLIAVGIQELERRRREPQRQSAPTILVTDGDSAWVAERGALLDALAAEGWTSDSYGKGTVRLWREPRLGAYRDVRRIVPALRGCGARWPVTEADRDGPGFDCRPDISRWIMW